MAELPSGLPWDMYYPRYNRLQGKWLRQHLYHLCSTCIPSPPRGSEKESFDYYYWKRSLYFMRITFTPFPSPRPISLSSLYEKKISRVWQNSCKTCARFGVNGVLHRKPWRLILAVLICFIGMVHRCRWVYPKDFNWTLHPECIL